MKNFLLTTILIFSGFVFFGQTTLPQASTPHTSNLVIGLPKISITQLEFVKADLASTEQIVTAEFIFNDNVLLIETDPNVTPALTFNDVENVLAKYFNKNDIHEKNVESFKKLKANYYKVDKFIIK